MAASPLQVRVRCPSVSPTPVQLEGCTAQTTFKDFQAAVLSALGLNKDNGDEPCPAILAGFPPRPLALAQDAAIGSTLSNNETVTVRLATPSASGANPEGGKWGRSKRQVKSAPSSSSSSLSASSRTSRATRASKSSPDADGKTAGAGGDTAAPLIPTEGSATDKGKAKEKNFNRGSSTVKLKPATKRAGGGGGGGSSSGRGGGKGGIHTLGGRLNPSPSYSHSADTRRAAGNSSQPGRVGRLSGSSGSASGNSSSIPSEAQQDSGELAAAAAADRDTDGPSRKRVRRGTGVALKSEGDIADRLLQAVGGGGKGTADRFFRKTMKLAVEKQYDQSRADARVRAAMGGWYTSSASAMQRRLGDGESVALSVSFSKGDGAKSRFEETVDRIPREQVAAVVRMIAGEPESREMLKPHNFAGASPRMFWSLVEHWGGDVPAALRAAAPDVDWSFLDTRDRKPSEKAVSNAIAEEVQRAEAEEERNEKKRLIEAKKKERERKKRRKEGILSDSSDDEPEPSPPAVAPAGNSSEVEATGACGAVAPVSPAEARQRAANAALARLTASQNRPRPDAAANPANGGSGINGAVVTNAVEVGAGATGASVTTAVGCSDDGRREGAHGGSLDELNIEGLTEVAGEAGAKVLVAAGVRTLGGLADRDEEDLTRQLGVLQEDGEIHGGAAASEGGRNAGEAKGNIGAEEVSEWVQAARGEELDEIMADIVGGDEDVVEALEQVSVSTPRDLVRLGAFPDVLVGAVRDRLGAERFAPLEERITAAAVESWRRIGDRLLEQRPWLELWVHER